MDEISNEVIEDNLRRVEEGKPLTMPLRLFDGRLKARHNYREISKIPGMREIMRATQKEYNRNPRVIKKRKEYAKKYSQKPETQERRKEYAKKYNKRPEVIKHKREYARLPKVIAQRKISQKKYHLKPETQKRIKKYRQQPEYKARRRIYARKYNQTYPVKERKEYHKYHKEYRSRPEVIKKKREYNKRPEVIEKRKKHNQLPKVKERWRRDSKKRYKIPHIKLSKMVSKGIYNSIKSKKAGNHWETLVDFTLQELMDHLENQFTKLMTWKNHGKYWHLDHRIPKSHFNFNTYSDEGFKKCWALENLQPKRGIDNSSKGNRYSEPTLNQILSEQTG